METQHLTHLDVPRDYANNLAWRIAIREWAMDSPDRQQALLYWCSQDFRLFVNAFCWLFEPRENVGAPDVIIPFILWDHQDAAVDTLVATIGKDDIGFDKSRGEGASWIVLMLFLWRWLFFRMNAFGLVSRNELAADNPSDPDSLMWKLDWALKMLPPWMVPNFDRNQADHTLVNLDNGSQIVGYAATGDIARGGRKLAFLMDEIASFKKGADQEAMNSTSQVTECRILVSTPKGPYGAFYDAMHGENSMIKISLKWQQNPLRKAGLYTVKAGRPVLLDWKYWRTRAERPDLDEQGVAQLAYKIQDETASNPFKYRFMLKGPFVKDSKPRSPWYDRQCRKPNATPRGIAQELDLDYSGSTALIFDISVLERLQKEMCLEPRHVGDLLYEMNPYDLNVRWSSRPGGEMQLWCALVGGSQRPPSDRNYILGADIASGLAGPSSSNSCLVVTDCLTDEEVCQFASPRVSPDRLAWIALALATFFSNGQTPAKIIPEINGTWGGLFVKTLRELGFSNFYLRESDEMDVNRKRKKKIGFYSDKNSKPPLIYEWYSAISSGQYKCRSKMTLEEAKHYILDDNGIPTHIDSMTAEDPSGAKGNHGDRVIATCLSWRGRREFGTLTQRKDKATFGQNTFGARFEAWKQAKARSESSNKYVW